LVERCDCLAKGRRRFTFWLSWIRFLLGLRGIFAVCCSFLWLQNRRERLEPNKCEIGRL